MTDHMSKVGANLDKAVDSYNSLVGSYERKVMPQVRRFEELQIPTEDRAVEAPAELGVRARMPQITDAKSDTPLLDSLPQQPPVRRAK
jgi:DNA recombination protein RmuC